MDDDEDDELDRLVMTVVERFGEDVLSDAQSRALLNASKELLPAPAGSDVREGLLPPGVADEALRVELRALLRPH